MVGLRVRKKSGKPFKSGNKINTVKGIVKHPQLPGEQALIFFEDDSYVLNKICIVTEDFEK